MARRIYTLQNHLKESLKDPSFRKAWEEAELEYQIAQAMIAKRLTKRMTQKDLARKTHTTQTVISRIENMSGNPTVSLLKRITQALGLHIRVSLEQ